MRAAAALLVLLALAVWAVVHLSERPAEHEQSDAHAASETAPTEIETAETRPADGSSTELGSSAQPEIRVDAELRAVTIGIGFKGQWWPGADVHILEMTPEVETLALMREPIPDAVLDRARRVATGEDGKVTVDLPNTRHLVVAMAPGGAPSGDYLEPDQDEIGIGIHIEALVSGTVRRVDGTPVPNARIEGGMPIFERASHPAWALEAERLAGLFVRPTATTDHDGRFTLHGVIPGQSYVHASADGLSSWYHEVIAAPTSSLEIVLGSGATVSGVVTDQETGAPIRGARVWTQTGLEAYQTTVKSDVAETDDQGRFTLRGVTSEVAPLMLVAAKTGYAARSTPLERLQTGETRGQDVALVDAVRLHGVIREEKTGKPIPSVKIDFYREPGGHLVGYAGSGPDGSFVFDLAEAGAEYSIWAYNGYHEEKFLSGVVADGDPVAISLNPPGRVHGRITGDGDAAVSGHVRLSLFSGADSKQLDRLAKIEEGRFDFSGVRAGLYTLEAFVDGYARTTRAHTRVSPPDTDDHAFDIELKRGAELTGRVFDVDTGEPVVGAKVRLAKKNRRKHVLGALPIGAETDSSGVYRFDGAAPLGEEITILVDHPPYAVASRSALVQADVAIATLDVGLSRGATVRMRVLGPDGIALAPVRAHVISADRPDPRAWSADGEAVLERIEPGDVSVRVKVDNHPDPQLAVRYFVRELSLKAGDDVTVDFHAMRGGVIHGHVEGPLAADMRRRWTYVFWRSIAGGQRQDGYGPVGRDGRFRLIGVTPGPAEVWVKSTDVGPGVVMSHELTVEDGVEHEVVFVAGGATLSGRVTDAGGAPIVDARVEVRPTDSLDGRRRAAPYYASSDHSGDYAVVGLQAGPQVVSVVADGYGDATVDVDVDVHGESTAVAQDFVLRPEAVLEVRGVTDGGAVVEDTSITCRRADRPAPAATATDPDEAGAIRFAGLEGAPYLVHASSPPLFPAWRTVTIASGERTAVDLVLRRRGDLQVMITDLEGTPMGDVPVEIISDLDGDSSVSGWIDLGEVTSSTGGLSTDARGKLRLSGLPVGTYRVRAIGSDRTIDVEASDEARVAIQAF